MKKRFKNQGSALIVSVLIMVLIVTIALTVTLVSIRNQTVSNGEYRSSQSFQMADTGIEDLMYQLTKAGYAEVNQIPDCQTSGTLIGLIKRGNYVIRLQDSLGNAISCNSSTPTSLVVSIKSVSSLSSQSRAVEADVVCRSPFKVDSNTVALYHFQEEGNSILDSSGLNNIGAVNGTVPSVSGICNARFFDGSSSDYINVPDNNPLSSSLKLSGEITVEAWVKWNGSNVDWQRIVGKGDYTKRNYGLWMGPDSTRGWLFQILDGIGGVCNAQDTNASDIGDNKWHYLAGTYDGSQIKLYLDGKQVADVACSITPATSDDPLTIGYSVGYPVGHAPFSGVIDEVRISKKAKSGSDIQAEFDKGAIFNLP